MRRFVSAFAQRIAAPLFFFACAILHPFVYADTTPEVVRGLQWLSSQVQVSGVLLNEAQSIATPIQSRSEAAQTLKLLSVAPASLIDAVANESEHNTEYLARQVITLAGAGRNASPAIDQLLSSQNPDGGFGGAVLFASNPLDTAWTLLALRAANAGSETVISNAVIYLLSLQDASGGYAFRNSHSSRPYVAAIVSLALQTVTKTPAVSNALNKLNTWFVSQQGVDGSWGDVAETSLAYLALHASTSDSGLRSRVAAFLVSYQDPDGSWDGDPYVTALAVRVLFLQPRLVPTTGDVVMHVVDASTGRPITGATAVIQELPNVSASSDLTGQISFSSITAGSYSVVISASGYMLQSGSFSFQPSATIDLGIISMTPAASTGILQGTVLDGATGTGLSGVLISLTGSANATTTTLANGAYSIGGLAPGAVAVSASKAGYASVGGTGVIVAGSSLIFSPTLSTIGPAPGVLGGVIGQVTDSATQAPLSGVTITIGATGKTATSGVDGRFSVAGINAGTYPISFALSGYATKTLTAVLVAAGNTTDLQKISLGKALSTVVVFGKVTDLASGLPIAKASVTVFGANMNIYHGVTDASGNYRISGIELGQPAIRFSAIGYASETTVASFPNYGEFKVDHTLRPGQDSNLSLAVVSSAQSHYGAYAEIPFHIQAQNAGNQAATATVGITILDADDNVVDLVQGTWLDVNGGMQSEFQFPVGATSLSVPWNTRAFPPGTYSAVARIYQGVNIASGGALQLAERQVTFTIDPTQAIGNLTVTPLPRFTNFEAIEAVTFDLDVVNRSNIPVSTTIAYQLNAPSGAVVFAGTSVVNLLPTEAMKSISLNGVTHKFVESGIYPVVVHATDGPVPTTIIGKATTVAPRISIEPSQHITPSVVAPDGDKLVKVNIDLKGIGWTPGSGTNLSPLKLTGATVYDVTAAKVYGGHGWDTTGANWVCNMYLLDESGTFLNSGEGAATSLDVDISQPGTHRFFYRGEGGGFNWPVPSAGLSLFFNKSLNPGISVFVPFNVVRPPMTALGNGSLGINDGVTVPGANSFSFAVGDTKVVLKAFNHIDYSQPIVAPVPNDLTSCFNSVSNGNTDYSGVIELEVSGIPDPRSLLHNVRVIETLSNAGNDLDQSSFTKPPFSVTSTADEQRIEWRYDTFSATSVDSLGFDLVLKNLLPGEKRVVSRKVELLYEDVNGNSSRTELDPQYVDVYPSAFELAPSTDKASYGPSDVVLISSKVKNLSTFAGTAKVRVSIKDTNNVLVSELGISTPQTIAGGSEANFNGINFLTGNTVAGSYQVFVELIDNSGKVFTNGTSPFTIIAGAASLSAKLSTDKQAYAPSDTVQLTSKVSNLTQNLPVNDLRVITTVKNLDGSVRFTKTETLAQLGQGAVKEYRYDLPLNMALAGSYSATLTVTNAGGAQLAQSDASFSVASSSTTGSGLSGTLTLSTKQVAAGDNLVLSFSASNHGNSALAGLPLSVRLIDPAAQQVIASFPYTTTLPVGASFNGATTWSVGGVASGTYVAVLSAVVGSNTLTLAQDTFSVSAPTVQLDITQQAAPWQNVLVYSACKRAADDLLGQCGAQALPAENAATLAQCDSARVTFLDQYLTGLGIAHKVTSSGADFLHDVRSGLYNTYWVSNGATALREPTVSELQAAVLRGDGLLLDGLSASRNLQLTQCAGVTFNGKYAVADQPLSVLGTLFAANSFRITALPAQIKAAAGAVAQAKLGPVATATDGIVSGSYGQGKTLTFGFDWLDTLRTQGDSRWSAITQSSLGYLTPPIGATPFVAGEVFTLRTAIHNAGQTADLQVLQTLPPGAQILATEPAAQTASPATGATASWSLNVPANTDRILTLRLRVPSTAGTASIATTTSTVKAGVVTPVQTRSFDFTVQSANDVLTQLIASVTAMTPATPDDAAARTAILNQLNRAKTALTANRLDQTLRQLLAVQTRMDNGISQAATLARLIEAVEWLSVK